MGPPRNGKSRLIKKVPCRVLIVLGCALLMFGCSQRGTTPALVTIEHEISPQPARVGVATITFKLADALGSPITRAKVAVEADMSHAGMSPVFADALEDQPGRYQARVKFEMAGDWILLLHVTLASGQTLERQIGIRAFRSN